MKPLFIVNNEQGSRVITESVLTSDIREAFKNANDTNYKRKDVESLAYDVVLDNAGKAITQENYDKLIAQCVYGLQMYNSLTPFSYITNHLKSYTSDEN